MQRGFYLEKFSVLVDRQHLGPPPTNNKKHMASTIIVTPWRPLPLYVASFILIIATIIPSHQYIVAAESIQPVTVDNDAATCVSHNDGECTNTNDQATAVYVIGDLHGDAICTASWVNRTGLIANLFNPELINSNNDPDAQEQDRLPLYSMLNDPLQWKWKEDKSTLVFMGDYVDKGPTSKQTVQFVKDLTTAFPDKVTAILGNHELELLRDRDARIPPESRYSSYSFAVVHPGEYHNYFASKDDASDDTEDSTTHSTVRSLDQKDDLVLDLLHEAVMEVYSYGAHSAVRMIPSLPSPAESQKRGIMYAITDIIPPEHRLLAAERLQEYQDAYLNSFRSGSELGDWMEKRPIMHLAENINTLFVHGGVSPNVGVSYLANGKADVDQLNAVWHEHSNEGRLYDFLTGKGMSANDIMGYVVYELLTYRGNHPGYSKWESHGTVEDNPGDDDEVCKAIHTMLSKMDGIDRVAVGHTPGDQIRIYCNGAFLALDSTLGRWIRGSGNEYCPGPEHFEKRKGVDVQRTSRNGKYACVDIGETCQGQITRLDSDGTVHVLTM